MSFLIRKPHKLCSFKFGESLFLKVLLSFTLRDDIVTRGGWGMFSELRGASIRPALPASDRGSPLVPGLRACQYLPGYQ